MAYSDDDLRKIARSISSNEAARLAIELLELRTVCRELFRKPLHRDVPVWEMDAWMRLDKLLP